MNRRVGSSEFAWSVPGRGVITGVALGVLLVVLLASAALAAGRFIDDDGNTHEGNIEAIAAAGITRGCNPPINDRYCPSDPVTRGQMAAFLRRAFNLPAATQDHFVDDDGNTFEGDINALAEAGITRGCNPPRNNRYCPDEFVTRGQMAAFLRRAFGYPTVSQRFFVDVEGSTFEADINAIADVGVTRGCNPPANTRYCPDDLVLRDQMASFLARALGLKPIQPVDPCAGFPSNAILVSRGGNNSNGGGCEDPVRTIQRGIDIAPVGGLVLVDSGTYLEQVDITKRLTIEALTTGAVIVDGLGGDSNAAVVETRLGIQVNFHGFVIRNGPEWGVRNRGNLTITDTIIRANQGPGIFNEQSGSIALSNTTLANHNDTALWNRGEASLRDVIVRDNLGFQAVDNEGDLNGLRVTVASNSGVGLRNSGNLKLEESAIVNNANDNSGGGLFNWDGGIAELIDSSVVGNSSTGWGGGIYNDGAGFSGATFFPPATLILDRVLVAFNSAEALGGGVYSGGAASLLNVTISGNDGGQQGGGVYSAGGCCFGNRGVFSMTNSTVAANSAAEGGGVLVQAGSTVSVAGIFEMKNSIVADNISGLDCVAVERDFQEDGILTSLGHNLDSDGSCGLNATGDISNANPLLEGLANNGGSSQTHALSSGSPAVDAADDSAAPSVDQRGVTRPQGPASDIGAYELVK